MTRCYFDWFAGQARVKIALERTSPQRQRDYCTGNDMESSLAVINRLM